MRIAYVDRAFRQDARDVIAQANQICASYRQQGFDLTLRQLYYQFVSRGLIPNKDTEYKRLGSIINDARLAGELDWEYIVDRTRNLEEVTTWRTPAEILEACRRSYLEDLWRHQSYRPEVWIEKDALVGVIEGVCDRNRVPYFSCRGYTSQSEMWSAGQRLAGHLANSQTPIIIHLGDHDPSGIDMTRDIQDRLSMFAEEPIEVRRIALTMAQINQYNPPPNPAKLTDSRGADYVQNYGYQSWELDALAPPVLDALIQDAIDDLKEPINWQETLDEEDEHRNLIGEVSNRWDEVSDQWPAIEHLLDTP